MSTNHGTDFAGSEDVTIVSKALNMNFTVADFALVTETLAQTEASLANTQTELANTKADFTSITDDLKARQATTESMALVFSAMH